MPSPRGCFHSTGAAAAHRIITGPKLSSVTHQKSWSAMRFTASSTTEPLLST